MGPLQRQNSFEPATGFYKYKVGSIEVRLFCQAWHLRRTRDDGQWFVLPLKDVPGSL